MFSCPVCRYQQTPEEEMDQTCFECDAKEVEFLGSECENEIEEIVFNLLSIVSIFFNEASVFLVA